MVFSIYSCSPLHAVDYFCASTTAFVILSSVHDVEGVFIELLYLKMVKNSGDVQLKVVKLHQNLLEVELALQPLGFLLDLLHLDLVA